MNKKIRYCVALLLLAAAAHAQVKVRTLTTKDSIDFAKRIDSLRGQGGAVVAGNYILPHNGAASYYLGGDTALHPLPATAVLKTDTAAMLSPYLRANVAAGTYQPKGSYVPATRVITINGTAFDLSQDRIWTIAGGGTGSSNSTVTALPSSASISWDYTLGNIATLTLSTNAVLSIANTADADAGYLIVTQDATGGRTISLPDAAGFTILSGANKTTTLGFVKVGGTFKWTGDYVVTTTGTGAATLTGNVINIPANTGGGGSVDLTNYYNKSQVDSALATKPDSIDLVIDNSTLIGSGTNADPLRVNPANSGNATIEQSATFSAINTANTQTRLIEVAADETNSGKTTYYAYNNKVSPNTMERFTTTTVSLPSGTTTNTQAIQTTEGQPLQTTEGQTIQFN